MSSCTANELSRVEGQLVVLGGSGSRQWNAVINVSRVIEALCQSKLQRRVRGWRNNGIQRCMREPGWWVRWKKKMRIDKMPGLHR